MLCSDMVSSYTKASIWTVNERLNRLVFFPMNDPGRINFEANYLERVTKSLILIYFI